MPTVLITGASRGIGLGLVRLYAEQGWNVIATARSPAAATDLSAIPGVSVETLEVTDVAAVAKLAEKYKHTPIDVLINNAGVLNKDEDASNAPTLEAFRETFDTNVFAPLNVAIALTPSLVQSSAPKLVGISSIMGSIARGNGGHLTYRGSKAALNAIYHSLAADLKDKKITVLTIHPGWVQTDMGGPNASISIDTSVNGIKSVIDKASLKDTGRFLQYDGTELPW